MSDDPLKPGGALEGRLFQGLLKRLAESREPEPGDRIGAWRIVCELGRGGSGVVYLAERADGAFSQQVALKWLRGDRPVPGGREALARERELLASLDHPHIVRLIDGGETEDGMLWFAMDLAEGETIDRHARNLPPRHRLMLVAKLCRAVHHAHRRGLIHGDIKPSNVLIDGRGDPRLVDFGISRLKGGGLGSSYGLTPDYASPEQRAGDELTTASDIWQLGRLLEDLIGDAIDAADLRSIMARATAPAPAERYASASAMAADIDAWLERRVVLAYGGGAGYRAARWVQRNQALSLVSGLAIATLLAGAVWATWQLAQERDIARAEAERAEAALVEAEVELARAQALQDFLLSLFRAPRPDRPADELPSTEQLLASGARRAMDTDSVSDADRFGMLITIGDVYISLGQPELAAPLNDEALELARGGNRPEDLARALLQKGVLTLHLRANAAAQAADLFARAEEAAAGAERAGDTWVHARTRRAWLHFQHGRAEKALELLEPVASKVDQGTGLGLSNASRLRLANTLGAVHDRLGHYDKALAHGHDAVALSSMVHGAESLNHAIERANLAAQQITLGRFDQARGNLDLALDLYQRIFDQRPVNYRAAALGSLAALNLYTGQWDLALEAAQAAYQEWAGVLQIEPAEYAHRDSHQGWMLTRMQRLEEARPFLQRAADRFADPPASAGAAIGSRALLALVHCRLGDAAAGQSVLEALAAWPKPDGVGRRAEIKEAQAACLHAREEHAAALAAIDASLALPSPPGEALFRAQRLQLRAELLDALDQPEAATRAREKARSTLREVGLKERLLQAHAGH